MPRSMTGFGQASFADSEMSVDVAVRSVNGKQLRTKVSLGLHMPAIEEQIQLLVARRVTRGTVTVNVRIDWAGAGRVVFNERIVASYVSELEKLRRKLGLSAEVRVDEVAVLPGAMEVDTVSRRAAGHVWRKVRPVVVEALERMVETRTTEGRALSAEIRGRCQRISRLLRRVERRLPQANMEYRDRLTDRVRESLERVGVQLDPAPLAREIILHAERADLTEELCRMKAHVEHCLRALQSDGEGRTLEFIAQEMNREANTMASKAADPVLVEWIIDLRGEVGKIREQVLNIE